MLFSSCVRAASERTRPSLGDPACVSLRVLSFPGIVPRLPDLAPSPKQAAAAGGGGTSPGAGPWRGVSWACPGWGLRLPAVAARLRRAEAALEPRCYTSCRAGGEALTSVSGPVASGALAKGRAGRRSVGEAAYPAQPLRRSGAPGGPRTREAAGRPEEGPGPRC